MKTKITSLICAFLMCVLCSCGQAQVDSERLLTGSDGGTPEEVTSDAGDSINEEEGLGPADDYVETDGNIMELEDFFGYGHVRYYINDTKFGDNMDAVGINEDVYQLSGSGSYDHYITVFITVENVDIAMDDEETATEISDFTLINIFQLYSQNEQGDAYSMFYEPVYFDQGSTANTDPKRYFEYTLPNAGETLDVVIGFGLSDADLSIIEENSGLYLRNYITMDMMKIEGIL